MKQGGRLFSCLLVLLVIFVLFASLYFVLHEAHHDCEGEDCPVCRLIAICRNTLRTFAVALLLLFALLGFHRIASTARSARDNAKSALTPVSLKVRLLN